MTTPVLHTPECRAETLQHEQAHRVYVSMWPDACNACSATGVIHFTSTYNEPGVTDTCPACEGKCPRCGYQFPDYHTDDSGAYENFYEGQILCPGCGLEFTNPDVMPPHPSEYGPCECEEAAMLATLEEH